MDHDALLEQIREEAGLADRDRAEELARATLAGVAERITGGEADDLSEHLPRPLAQALQQHRQPEGTAKPVSVDALCRRVADDQGGGVTPEQAGAQIGAVLRAVERAAPDEFANVRKQLPREYEALL